MLWEEIDMVGDNHDVADLEFGVHTTCGIRDEQRLDAQFVHHTYWECHVLHRVALIEVETTLHGEDVNTPEFTENQFATMAFHCRYREVGNLRVGILRLVSYF